MHKLSVYHEKFPKWTQCKQHPNQGAEHYVGRRMEEKAEEGKSLQFFYKTEYFFLTGEIILDHCKNSENTNTVQVKCLPKDKHC